MGKRNKERIKRIEARTEFALSIQRAGQPTKPRPVRFIPGLGVGELNRQERRKAKKS